MEQPVALRLTSSELPIVHRVQLDSACGEKLTRSSEGNMPAVVVTRNAAILPAMSAGMIDATDIIAVVGGDWNDAVLIILPEEHSRATKSRAAADQGDAAFLADVERNAPDLVQIATDTIETIRAAGVEGELVKSKLGRWVNQPLNTFTLKAQPRAKNLHFTLYGNPSTYEAGGFLLQDQNSYSRGWVRDPDDVKMLAHFAQQAHARRAG